MADAPLPPGENIPKQRHVKVPAEEWDKMRRMIALNEMEELVVGRVKTHFAWVAVIAAVIGIVGINAIGYALINEQLAPELTEVRKATAKANAEAAMVSQTISQMNEATRQAREAAAQAAEDTEKILENAQEQNSRVSDVLGDMKKKADRLDDRFASITAASENVRGQLETAFEELDNRLDRLAANIPTALPEQRELKAASKLDQFKDNSKYELYFTVVGSTRVDSLKEMMDHFKSLGYKITGTDEPSTDELAGPSEKNKINVFYTDRGQAKLNNVILEIEGFSDFKVIEPMDVSDGDLAGDIQISVQAEYYKRQ